MRISDWSSDVCSSDLHCGPVAEDSSTGAPGTRCRRLQLSRPAVRDGRPAADDAALRAADLRLVLRGEDAGGPRAGGLAPAATLAAAAGGCPGHQAGFPRAGVFPAEALRLQIGRATVWT